MEKRRILIIDDDREIWKAYRMVLAPEQNRAGIMAEVAKILDANSDAPAEPLFELAFAAQGQEGFQLALEARMAANPFALAFIDVRMPPGWDGMETAIRIREIDREIELIIVTAYSDHSCEEIVRKVGSPDKLLFLRKPFDPEELKQLALSLTGKWLLARQEELSRRELQGVLHTSPAAIFVLESDGTISDWNPAAERITGRLAAEVVGGPCVFRTIAVDRPCCSCSTACCTLHDGQPGREIVIVDAEGNRKILAVNMARAENGGGKSGKLIGSFWDMTSIRETEAALVASEQRFRSLVETTTDWVWEVDTAGNLTYCSPVCYEIYGYHPGELLGRCYFDILHDADSARTMKEMFLDCLRGARTCQAHEHRCRKKNGEFIDIETSGTPFFDQDRRVIGYRGIDRDISARKSAEEDRRLLEERYRQAQKLEALGTLAGGIAHDMNNILTPILGYCSLGKLKFGRDHFFYQQIEAIENCTQRAAELIRRIMGFCRKQEMHVRPMNLNLMVQELAKMLRRLIREDIELGIELTDDLWLIQADRSQMEQILINLVVNARDAMDGPGRLVIRTSMRSIPPQTVYDVDLREASGDFAVLSVSDQGRGIDRHTLSMIFDPFFTTKEAGKGTGLGLSNVHGIVASHNGRILVETELERGSSFHILLPRCNPALRSEETAIKSEARMIGGSETILLVEDDLEVLQMLAASLAEAGYHILTAPDGNAAQRIFAEHHDDIALLATDLIMPGMGGKSLADIARRQVPWLPILYMTGHSFDIDTEELKNIPHTMLMQKPFSLEQFCRSVRALLDNSRPHPHPQAGI
ncbi:MAG: PAS domain S-box protein [Thermodesulfobacteriota bacterium]